MSQRSLFVGCGSLGIGCRAFAFRRSTAVGGRYAPSMPLPLVIALVSLAGGEPPAGQDVPKPDAPAVAAPVSPTVSAPAARDDFASAPADLADLVTPIRERFGVPALAAAVVAMEPRPHLIGLGVCGHRQAGADVPVAGDDLWHLGSCTKAFTATLCALLVEEGRLRWTSTVGEMLAQDVPTMDAGWKDVRLEELLHHTGGAPSAPSSASWRAAWTCTDAPEVCRRAFLADLLSHPPAATRGTFAYSNQGYALAGRMCEAAASATWESLVRTRVCEPLGITSLGFGVPSAHQPGHAPKGHAESGAVQDIDNPAAIAPAGTMHMTLADWARFVAFHTAAAPDPRLPMSQANFDRLHTADTAGKGAAMGWMCAERPWGGAVLNHAGSNTCWYCVAWLSPSRGFAVLVTCNQGGAKAAAAADACASEAIQWWQRAHPGRQTTPSTSPAAPG